MADYVHNLYEHAHGDRLYGTFRQVGTETGRMSSGRPNLQNVPRRDLRVRYVVRAGPGKVLVGADLDNVELRVLAAYAPGGRLEQAFADGADLHQQTADQLGIERDAGKTINYAILYGAGVPLIASRLGHHARRGEGDPGPLVSRLPGGRQIEGAAGAARHSPRLPGVDPRAPPPLRSAEPHARQPADQRLVRGPVQALDRGAAPRRRADDPVRPRRDRLRGRPG